MWPSFNPAIASSTEALTLFIGFPSGDSAGETITKTWPNGLSFRAIADQDDADCLGDYVLNLYFAPRSAKAPIPDDAAINAVGAFLMKEGFCTSTDDTHVFSPGPQAAWLFTQDAHDDLLPAELTFDELRIEHRRRAVFLPERQPADAFPDAQCKTCGDGIDLDALSLAFDKLGYFPVDRFEYTCPSCRMQLALRDIDFGQTTAIARFWLFVEGAGTRRIKSNVLDALAQLLKLPLVIVSEVPEEKVEDWVPAQRLRRR